MIVDCFYYVYPECFNLVLAHFSPFRSVTQLADPTITFNWYTGYCCYGIVAHVALKVWKSDVQAEHCQLEQIPYIMFKPRSGAQEAYANHRSFSPEVPAIATTDSENVIFLACCFVTNLKGVKGGRNPN